jgi:hypothetical protein
MSRERLIQVVVDRLATQNINVEFARPPSPSNQRFGGLGSGGREILRPNGTYGTSVSVSWLAFIGPERQTSRPRHIQ